MVKVPVKLVTWDEIVEWSWGLANIIKSSGYKVDVVIAIARGGYVPARLLCDFLGVENLLSIQSQHWTEAARKGERAVIKFEYEVDLSEYNALLVDDIVDTGESFLLAKKFVEERWKPRNLKTAALQWISSVAKFKPDFYFMEVKEWIWFQYPWTRMEDIYQFMKRMVVQLPKEEGITVVDYEAVKSKFFEWYGIDPGEKYLREAFKKLVDEGILVESAGKYTIRTPT